MAWTVLQLREWRTRRGLTSKAAAKMLGYSVDRYSHIERMTSSNTIDLTLELACKYFDVTDDMTKLLTVLEAAYRDYKRS